MRFGSLDFSNIYFLKNRNAKTRKKQSTKLNLSELNDDDSLSAKSEKSSRSNKSCRSFRASGSKEAFKLDLLFIDKGLCNIFLTENDMEDLDLKGKFISQTSIEEQ